MEYFSALLGRNGFLPHGYCFTWSPGLLWSMVVADGLIAASYFSIPVALVSFVRRRGDTPMNWLVWMFSAFIFACGITHLMDIWTIWQPDYALQTATKLVTAAISVATAAALWPLIPKALQIPSVERLQAVIARLEAEARRRQSAEENLADTQESLAITLSAIGAGFVATDRDGRITRMNPVAERILGWPLAEARGQPLWTVWKRDGLPEAHTLENPVDLMLASGLTLQDVRAMVIVSRQGERTPIELQATPTYGPDQQVRGMALVFRDMTQIRRAEAAGRQLAAIVESSNDAIIGSDTEGRITSWNRAAEMLFGQAAAETVGKPLASLLLPPGEADAAQRLAHALASGGRVPPFDAQWLAQGGRHVDVSVTVSPVLDADGRQIGASSIVRDVSQQRLHEALRIEAIRLEAENRQVLEANRVKSEFLANMSHELRTPLNAVIGFADILHAGIVAPGSAKSHEYLDNIRISGRHLLQLINDVLDLSKVESGKFDFFPETVDVQRLIGEVNGILHTEARRKRVAIVSETDPALGPVQIDPARLKQVLYNFVSNAIKFTPAGGRITVRAGPEGPAQFRIEVEDTGVGIAPTDIDKLFRRFQQIHTGYAKPHSGTGLGLALTRRLVELQGGSVGVRSELGRGSVFHVVLPRQAAAGPALVEAAPAVPVAGPAREPGTILVVEDDPADQARIAQVLRAAGHAVVLASTVEQARRAAASQRYAAVTLDLILPDGSGLDVLKALRAEGPNCDVPVVVLTMVTERSAMAGFHVADVLAKPIQGDDIRTALRHIGLAGGRPARVLVIDDEAPALELMAEALRGAGMEPLGALGGQAGLRALDDAPPDAVILDLVMPEPNGFTLLHELRARPPWREVPVYIWTSLDLTPQEMASLAHSAQAIVTKGHDGLDAILAALRALRTIADLAEPINPTPRS